MNCTECGYNLDGIPSTPYCPECGAGRNSPAIIEAKQKRDSLAEFGLWGSVALGVAATLSAFVWSPATWIILTAGFFANIVLAFMIERAGRLAREHTGAIFGFVRAAGVCIFRIAAMWFTCFFLFQVIYVAWDYFQSR